MKTRRRLRECKFTGCVASRSSRRLDQSGPSFFSDLPRLHQTSSTTATVAIVASLYQHHQARKQHAATSGIGGAPDSDWRRRSAECLALPTPLLRQVGSLCSPRCIYAVTHPCLRLPSDYSLQSSQIALTKDVQDRLIDSLSACDKKWYYIFSQEHVGAEDLKDGAMPKLQRRLAEAGSDRVVQIPEVVQMGDLSAKTVAARLAEACAPDGKSE